MCWLRFPTRVCLTGRRVPSGAVLALRAMADSPQTIQGGYFNLRDTHTLRTTMAQYLVWTPADSNDPIITDPYIDALGSGRQLPTADRDVNLLFLLHSYIR